MKISKLSVLFVLDKLNTNLKGLSPLRCRITYLGKRKVFSIGVFIRSNEWNSKMQILKKSNIENNQINTQLSLIKQEVNQAFLYLQVQEKSFDVEDIYRQYKGENIKEDKTIIEMFNFHISRQEKLIGISTTKVSVAKFYQTKNHIKNFIKWKYNKTDFLLKELQMPFIIEFEYYLKAEKKFEQNTIHKTLQRFKQIVKIAVGLDFLNKDPFLLHKNKRPKKQVIFLTKEELSKIETHHFASDRLQQVADMFVFCCYTGLAYAEMSNLKKEDIKNGFDNKKWIEVNRQKTNRVYEIPLLSKAEEILCK